METNILWLLFVLSASILKQKVTAPYILQILLLYSEKTWNSNLPQHRALKNAWVMGPLGPWGPSLETLGPFFNWAHSLGPFL